MPAAQSFFCSHLRLPAPPSKSPNARNLLIRADSPREIIIILKGYLNSRLSRLLQLLLQSTPRQSAITIFTMVVSVAPLPAAIDLQSVVLVSTIVLSVALFVYLRYFYVDFAAIRGIPEIPAASLLYGHLYQLGNDHATTAQKWAEKYGWPIFQVRFGNRRVVVLNGFEVAREWIVTNQASTVDRPLFYTFHGIVSKTSGELARKST
jgi:hypothetical protein